MILDIEKHLHDWVFNPLDKMFDGEFPDSPMPYSINSIRMESLFDNEFLASGQAENVEYTESVEEIVNYFRGNEYADVVSKVLMPLYRELLFEPSKRMLPPYSFTNYKENPRKHLRYWTTNALRDILSDEKCLKNLFDGISLIQSVELCLAVPKEYFDQNILFLKSLVVAIEDGYSTDWESLYSTIKPELTKIPKNYKKEKLEYCCMLMAVIMIMRNTDITTDTRNKLLEQLCKKYEWDIIAYQYSILLGVVVRSDFKNPIQIVRLFSDTKKNYAHLLLACVNCRPSVVKAPQGQYLKQLKYDEAYAKLQEASKTDQEGNLDELFHVIFPDAICEDYSNDTLRITTAEIQKRIDEQQQRIHDLTELINNQNSELSELRFFRDTAQQMINGYGRDAISIEDLKNAIDSINDAEKAEEFFKQLDFILIENEIWSTHRLEIYRVVKHKSAAKNSETREIGEMITQAIEKQKPSIINQLNMGDGTQQLTTGLNDVVKKLEEKK